MIEDGLYTIVTTDAAVSALIGTRFFPDVLPENGITYPAVTYTGISLVDWRTLDLDAVSQVRLQFDVWAPSRSQANAVAAALYELLEEFSGPLPNGLVVDITRDGQRSGFDKDRRPNGYFVQTDWLIQLAE